MRYKSVPCPECNGHGIISEFSYSPIDGMCNGISGKICANCNGMGTIQVPITNLDNLRSLTPEALKFWYCNGRPCGGCQFGDASGCHILEWFQQPCEDTLIGEVGWYEAVTILQQSESKDNT